MLLKSSRNAQAPVGPGSYECPSSFPARNTRGALAYNVDATRRTNLELSQSSSVVGPGSYDLTKPIFVPSYKANSPNSMFASQTKRSASVDPVVKNKSKLRLDVKRID